MGAPRVARSPEKSSAASKRKEKDFEREINEDTSIHVVVRCRGRSDREIKENNGVVLSTPEGVKGKTLDLSMGPNAVSNKTYAFDKVFSPAADQTTVYEDVVVPVLDEVSIVTAYKIKGPTLIPSRCWQVTIAPSSHTDRLERERHIPCQAT